MTTQKLLAKALHAMGNVKSIFLSRGTGVRRARDFNNRELTTNKGGFLFQTFGEVIDAVTCKADIEAPMLESSYYNITHTACMIQLALNLHPLFAHTPILVEITPKWINVRVSHIEYKSWKAAKRAAFSSIMRHNNKVGDITCNCVWVGEKRRSGYFSLQTTPLGFGPKHIPRCRIA